MKSRLPILVAIVAAALPATFGKLWGQPPAAIPAESASSDIVPLPATDVVPLPVDARQPPVPQIAPTQLLAEAEAMLAGRRSIVAKVRHHAELYGRDVRGNGAYMQGPASSRLMRYELSLQAGNRQTHFLEINDGRHLWRRTQFEAEPDVERIDVDRVLAAAQQAGGPAGANPSLLLGLGGLGRLLAELNRDFEFTQSLPPGKLGDVPVYGVAGRWRPAALTRLGIDSVAKLRPHVPDHVVIYLGCDDFFPYQIEFRRSETGAGEGTGASWRRLLKLELFEVEFDVPLEGSQFHFAAEHLHYIDITERVLALRAAGQ